MATAPRCGSDRYAGQQELEQGNQVCLAHVPRVVQYAIGCGDTVGAPKIRDLLRWTIRIGKRRPALKDSTLAVYAAQAERRLDRLLGPPAAHPAGRELQRQVKRWRGKFFAFLQDRRVPPTHNVSERKTRPSVVFRKVTNGFRSTWGATVHAGYQSVTGTARLNGTTALQAVRTHRRRCRIGLRTPLASHVSNYVTAALSKLHSARSSVQMVWSPLALSADALARMPP